MRIVLTAIILVLFLITIALGAFVFGQLRGSFVEKSTTEALAQRLAASAQVVLPEGEGPFPVVLTFHGCGGLIGRNGPKSIMDEYAADARAAGIATVIVDSLTPRGIDFETAIADVCSGRRLRGAERAGDVLSMIEWAIQDSRFDTSRIAVAGWSHGAWSIMDLFAMDLRHLRPHNLKSLENGDAREAVRAVHLTYPYCGFPSLTRDRGWQRKPNTRLVVAENDETASPALCLEAGETMRLSGVSLVVDMIEGATHGFDETDQIATSKARYEPDKAKAARSAYAQWLTQALDVAPPPLAASEDALTPRVEDKETPPITQAQPPAN
jgi:dienelactone hydrolase